MIAHSAPMEAEATAVISTGICDHFLADHRRLETLLERLLAAFEANDREDIAKLWTAFEAGLLTHLEAEEKHLLPALQKASERDARVLIQEHRHIRTRLEELGVGIDLHIVRLTVARDFIHELRAHAKNEDRMLYKWSDAHLDEPERAAVITALRIRVTPQ